MPSEADCAFQLILNNRVKNVVKSKHKPSNFQELVDVNNLGISRTRSGGDETAATSNKQPRSFWSFFVQSMVNHEIPGSPEASGIREAPFRGLPEGKCNLTYMHADSNTNGTARWTYIIKYLAVSSGVRWSDGCDKNELSAREEITATIVPQSAAPAMPMYLYNDYLPLLGNGNRIISCFQPLYSHFLGC